MLIAYNIYIEIKQLMVLIPIWKIIAFIYFSKTFSLYTFVHKRENLLCI